MRNGLCILAVLLLLGGCGGKMHEAGDESPREPAFLDRESAKALAEAMNKGDLRRVREVSGRLGVNASTRWGRTLLHLAVANAPGGIVEYLIAEGADVNARAACGATPLHEIDIPEQPSIRVVDVEGMKKKLRLLLKAGADPNASDNLGWTPLHYLAWLGGDRESAEIYISAGANVNAGERYGLTPLDIAVDTEHDTIAGVLREHGGVPGDPLRREVLTAAEKGDLRRLRELHAGGASLEARYLDGNTPLHIASEKGCREVVEFLIAEGARIDAQGNGRRTPLFFAANAEIARLLISNGACVDAEDAYRRTPIFSAVAYDRKDVVELLLSEGAWVNVSDRWGETPLDRAKSAEMTELLRSHGARNGTRF